MEKSIIFDIFDVKIILLIFLIVLYFDIKDDLWKVKKIISDKFKKNKTMIPSTSLKPLELPIRKWLYLD